MDLSEINRIHSEIQKVLNIIDRTKKIDKILKRMK
jgi:hypothetical protein